MKVSGFTVIRNAIKFNYPASESIKSILPICDEFIVNVAEGEDGTLDLIKSINSDKIRIIQSRWDQNLKGGRNISSGTNQALSYCTGEWAFYLQADEVVHEKDLPRLKSLMQRFAGDSSAEALRFEYLHFYGSYWRYKNKGWYQKENRIIKNNGSIVSVGDGKGFMTKDGQHLKRIKTGAYIYHYGWVNPIQIMKERRINAQDLGYIDTLGTARLSEESTYKGMEELPVFLGSHPALMKKRIVSHELSRQDWQKIYQRNRFNPYFWVRSLFGPRRYYG